MLQTISFIIFIILDLSIITGILILGIQMIIAHLQKKTNPKLMIRLKKSALYFTVLMIMTVALVLTSQLTASTPKIVDENGKRLENSIAELTRVELNGHKQWISLRGQDKDKPVLLFLAGGPGGSQMAAARHELAALEKYFVVVNWDQPGSGKSYYSRKINRLSIETYIQDGYAITQYLKNRFLQDKIYLVGESWGSALGIFLADRFPDSYHGFIGTAQMINFTETEKLDYAKAMEIACKNGNEKIVQKLEENGVPPYYGKNITWKIAVYLNYLSAYMARNPEINNPGYSTIRDIASSEYGLLDKINFARGIINTFNHVYPQLYEINMITDYPKIDIPVYFFLGRHDINAPGSFVEKYVEVLDSPHKEIVWFEHSGHSPWINERDRFVKEVLSSFTEIKMEE